MDYRFSTVSVLATGPPIITQHSNNTAISYCHTLRSESNRERVRDKQQGRDKERKSVAGQDGEMREGEKKETKKKVRVKGVKQHVFTLKLL